MRQRRPVMRDGVDHPETNTLKQEFRPLGNGLLDAVWSLERGGKDPYSYGPLPIAEDLACAVRNLLILAEDMMVMWAQANLVAPHLVEIASVPPQLRNAQCPVPDEIPHPAHGCRAARRRPAPQAKGLGRSSIAGHLQAVFGGVATATFARIGFCGYADFLLQHAWEEGMLQIKVVLVDTTGTVKPDTMAAAAAALNVQVTRDLPQFWNVHAAVSYRPDAKSIPQGMWPVQLVDSLPPGEGGFHLTQHNQPYAKVIVTPGSDEWTVDASHEIVEMLVDPYGNRLQTSTAIDVSKGKIVDAEGKLEYLVEACDPCEANKFAYQIDGTMVSDFITPSFYDPHADAGGRYSFTSAVKKPREILPGGYISWVDPKTTELKQILWVDPKAKPVAKNLGPAPKNMSLREFVEAQTYQLSFGKRSAPPKATLAARVRFRAVLQEAALARAEHYV